MPFDGESFRWDVLVGNLDEEYVDGCVPLQAAAWQNARKHKLAVCKWFDSMELVKAYRSVGDILRRALHIHSIMRVRGATKCRKL